MYLSMHGINCYFPIILKFGKFKGSLRSLALKAGFSSASQIPNSLEKPNYFMWVSKSKNVPVFGFGFFFSFWVMSWFYPHIVLLILLYSSVYTESAYIG